MVAGPPSRTSRASRALQVALNDVDLCLRLAAARLPIVYTPRAHLYHHESGTRGRVHPPKDEKLVWAAWGDVIRKGDPYYNPNLTLTLNDWSLARPGNLGKIGGRNRRAAARGQNEDQRETVAHLAVHVFPGHQLPPHSRLTLIQSTTSVSVSGVNVW